MAHSPKKLLSLCRDILHRWFHVDFDGLPEWMRLTILSHADLASRNKGDVKGAIEEIYRSLITSTLGDSTGPRCVKCEAAKERRMKPLRKPK